MASSGTRTSQEDIQCLINQRSVLVCAVFGTIALAHCSQDVARRLHAAVHSARGVPPDARDVQRARTGPTPERGRRPDRAARG